jgi:signal transduction histidine kinase
MSRKRVVHVALAGFGLLVGLVLLAAYLGYHGSNQIQETAQDLVRERLIQSGRGAEVEALIVRETQELIDRLTWVLGLCFLLAAGTGALTVWTIQRAFIRLEWQSAELARVSWHLLDGHEKMARRFSHEMHDELGQSLSGLRRMLNGANDRSFASIRDECVGIVDEVLQNVRKLSQVLRPVILDDFGIDSGLRWLCERFTQRTQIPVHYQSNWAQRLESTEETHLFRITQEALTNIARHAEATEAWVTLSVEGNTIRLAIADNGRGLKTPAGGALPSLGLVGMRARARQMGGELIIENRKEGGVLIRVEVPLRQVEINAEQEDSSFVG